MSRPPAAEADADPGRAQREASFHDTVFASDARREAGKFYVAARAARAHYRRRVTAGCQGRSILEYGCGKGSAAFELAAAGATVIGIDISEVGIRQARQRAADLGLDERIAFRQMNAEALEFADHSFDRVCGSGILHHVDLERAGAEILRVLKPGAEAVFFEPLGHNPLINLYRHLTPSMRSADERPLQMHDLQRLAARFATAEHRFFSLLTLAAVPLRRVPGFGALLRGLEVADRALLRPPLRRYAWIVVTCLVATRDASASDAGRPTPDPGEAVRERGAPGPEARANSPDSGAGPATSTTGPTSHGEDSAG